jgi:hypothetical protein
MHVCYHVTYTAASTVSGLALMHCGLRAVHVGASAGVAFSLSLALCRHTRLGVAQEHQQGRPIRHVHCPPPVLAQHTVMLYRTAWCEQFSRKHNVTCGCGKT